MPIGSFRNFMNIHFNLFFSRENLQIVWKQCKFSQNLDTASYILVILILISLKHARSRVFTIIYSPLYNKYLTFYA